jgi:hypothetical protein
MVPIGAPKSLTDCARFFQVPSSAKQRAYEALRAFFVEGLPSAQAARSFGYSPGSFRVLCHQFRRDPAPAFFVSPKRGPRVQPHKTAARDTIIELDGSSFNLDFHSVPYFGEHPLVEPHYVAMRSRSQPSVLAFMAHDAESRAFCYANADLRKGEEADEIFRFIKFWKSAHGELPRHLVFDSKLTTYANLARLDEMGISFITLRRRTHKLLAEVAALPPSAWRTITLDVPTRKYKTPRIFEQNIRLAGVALRQLFVQDLGHDQPTILLTNDRSAAPKLITRYAQRMLIENALSDAVRFFHMDALSSSVGLKVDFDMTLLVIASTLYRLLARDMRGYDQAQARQIFRDLVDMPADIVVQDRAVTVEFHRRSHLPILLASDLFKSAVTVPWWNGASLHLSTYAGTPGR